MPLSADGLRTRSVGLVCLAAGLSVAAAAHPASDHDALFTGLGTEDGLSSAVVYSIDQDRTGFIWLGTEAGLDRYDGTGVSRWNLDPDRIVRPPADDVAELTLNGLYARATDAVDAELVGDTEVDEHTHDAYFVPLRLPFRRHRTARGKKRTVGHGHQPAFTKLVHLIVGQIAMVGDIGERTII